MANYLYNGVELPKIPVYDPENPPKEGYTDPCPYALLVRESNTKYEYDCYLYAAPFYAHDGKIVPAKYSGAQCHHYGYADGTWQYASSWLFGSGTALTGTAFWTNTDVYMRDDTSVLYLAASDPIPITAPEPLDPASMMMGWLTGRRIASQRKQV